MKHKEFILSLFICSFFHVSISAQDISGLWKGKIYWKGLERDTATAYFEIQKGKKPNVFTGISTCITDKPRDRYWYGKATFTCIYNQQSKKYYITEDSLLESSSRGYTDKYILTYTAAKKQLKGKVECDPKGPKGFLCGDTQIIELSKTDEKSPVIKKKEKISVRIGIADGKE